MSTRLNRFALTLVAAFVLSMYGAFLPAQAGPAIPATPAKTAPAAKTTPAAKAPKARTESVEGSVVSWDATKNSFSVKGDKSTWNFTWNKGHFAQVGKPAAGAKVKVWYAKDGKNLVATKVQVESSASPVKTTKKSK